MKILYIVSTLRNSGPISVLLSIIKYINKSEHNIFILSLSPEPVFSLRNEFVKMGVICINLNISRWNIFSLIKKFRRIIKNMKPDIIHSHGLRPDILSAIFLKKKNNCCCTIHNYAPIEYKMKYGRLLGMIICNIHFWAIKKISYSIACSESIANKLIERGIKTTIIQNGVDTDYFVPSSLKEKICLRKRLSLDRNSVIFISVGSLSSLKNQIFIIKEFMKYNKKFTLLFIGEGLSRSDLEHYSKKLKGNILFTGNIFNVLDYLKASDYFISASKSEGLPITVLEAASVGLPLLLSKIPPHQEILNKNKSAGNLFELRSSSLINAIINLTQEDYSLLSTNARRLVYKNFNAKNMSNQYQGFYNKMICKKNK